MIDEAFERARIAYWHGAKQEYPTPNDRLKAALNVARAIWEEEYEAKPDQISQQQCSNTFAPLPLVESSRVRMLGQAYNWWE